MNTAMYRAELSQLQDWDDYLEQHSGLPGPRANLELMYAAAELAEEALLRRYLAIAVDEAAVTSPRVFLVCCGVVGVGHLVNRGALNGFTVLRALASDSRWRVREAVAMALQIIGDADLPRLLAEMQCWAAGNLYEQRAAVAALCEPRLLKDPAAANRVLDLMDEITHCFSQVQDRKQEPYQVLKKCLSYGWSVAAAALPEVGKARMERWIACTDPGVLQVMRENLRKNRLLKMDAAWVNAMQTRIINLH